MLVSEVANTLWVDYLAFGGEDEKHDCWREFEWLSDKLWTIQEVYYDALDFKVTIGVYTKKEEGASKGFLIWQILGYDGHPVSYSSIPVKDVKKIYIDPARTEIVRMDGGGEVLRFSSSAEEVKADNFMEEK